MFLISTIIFGVSEHRLGLIVHATNVRVRSKCKIEDDDDNDDESLLLSIFSNILETANYF